MRKKFLIVMSVFCLVVFGTAIIGNSGVYAKNIRKQHCKVLNKNLKTDSDKLALIDNYQEKYFTIIKRNNVLLNTEDDKVLNEDRKELDKLFAEVKKQINNKTYLKEYSKIEKKYSKCNEITTTGINDFAEKNYMEVDNFLNKVYGEAQLNLSPEDLNHFFLSEQNWSEEVLKYETEYNLKDFGTIGTSIYYDYQINMKSFRALLLMLCL